MSVISDYRLYDIDDLIATWESGWEEFAKLYNELGTERHLVFVQRERSTPDELIYSRAYEIFDLVVRKRTPSVGRGQTFVVVPGLPAEKCDLQSMRRDSTELHRDISLAPLVEILQGFITLNSIRDGKCDPQSRRRDFTELHRDISLAPPVKTLRGFIALASIPDGKYNRKNVSRYWNKLIEDKNKGGGVLHDSLDKVLNALAHNDTLGDAIIRATDYKRFCRGRSKEEVQHYAEIEIQPHWRRAIRWLIKALNGEVSEEESWWNCAWAAVEPSVREMLQIKERISTGIPLTEDQIVFLNGYTAYGHPQGYWMPKEDQGLTHEIVIEPHCGHMAVAGELETVAIVVLVKPAFSLIQMLHSQFSKPRFVKQCRAPSCGKRFYTGWKIATNCPGSRGGKKNKCSLEWNRYIRYLRRVSKDPEKDWDNKQLKKDFLAYDKS